MTTTIGGQMQHMIMILLAVLTPFAVQAQEDTTKFTPYTYLWLESQGAVEKGEIGVKKPVIAQSVSTLTFGHQASNLVGVVATLAHANTSGADAWSEATITWSLANNSGLSVSAGPALERLGDEYNRRVRLNAFYDHESSASFLYGQLDVGQGASWWWVDGAVSIKKTVGVGVLAQMPDLGIGPKVELRMGNHISVWVAGLRQPNTKVEYGVFGLRLKFDK